MKKVYDELHKAERELTDELKTIVSEKILKFDEIEDHHIEILKLFTGFKKNIN
jgi:hypothetical protein